MNVLEVLQQCTILDSKFVRLPSVQLDRTLYGQVNDKLKKIGGRWKGRPINAFVFDHDPTDLLAELQQGIDRNLKQEYQFFETPQDLAESLVELADIKPHHSVLEPSAGRGAILKCILVDVRVTYFELMPENRTYLFDLPGELQLDCGGVDFLNADESIQYDRIVANPPWNRNQDIDHIRKMYSVLKPGGKLVSVASTHWQHSKGKKEGLFQGWLLRRMAEFHPVPAGTFKPSGTMVAGVVIVIDKPMDA